MAIKFPSKDDKLSSQLRDGLRLLAWQEHKAEIKKPEGVSAFAFYSEVYQEFDKEWKLDPVHKMEYFKLTEFIKGLGYTPNEILNFRAQHYAKRNGIPEKASQFDEELPTF